MAGEQVIFGLAERHYRDLARIFSRYPQIEQVLIFGSRAKQIAKPYSDFDLAVVAPQMTDADFTALWSELDDTPLVYKLDVLHLDRVTQPELRQQILEHGQYFYPLSMEHFLAEREKIHHQFHESEAGPAFFFKDDNRDRYAAYSISMCLLQDTGETLFQHRRRGFASESLQAYLEFWGVMQALFIQQDAIKTLYESVVGPQSFPGYRPVRHG